LGDADRGGCGARGAFGVGVGWGIFGHGSPLRSAFDQGTRPDGIAANTQAPPRQLQSAYGLGGLLDQARKKFGHTMGYRLLVYPDYGSMDRADPNDDRRKLEYNYRGGWDSPSVTSKDSDDRLVDLGKFEVFIVEPSKDPTARMPSRSGSTPRRTTATADT
jgi:hypothetical protein